MRTKPRDEKWLEKVQDHFANRKGLSFTFWDEKAVKELISEVKLLWDRLRQKAGK